MSQADVNPLVAERQNVTVALAFRVIRFDRCSRFCTMLLSGHRVYSNAFDDQSCPRSPG